MGGSDRGTSAGERTGAGSLRASRPTRAIALVAPSARFQSEFLAASDRSRTLHGNFARPPVTAAQFRVYLRRVRSASHEGHLVLEQETGRLVGVVNLNDIVQGSFRNAHLG
jgi:ribosomal-protein-alanine N-acetyltransferase